MMTPRTRQRSAVLLTGLVVLLLSGCSLSAAEAPTDTAVGTPVASASAAPTVTPTPTPTSTPTPAAPILEDLHQAYLASGLPCDWNVTENLMAGTTQSGGCRNSENGISTFASQDDVDALLQLNIDSIEPGLFLVGDRWVVGSEHPEDLITAQTTMGGALWPSDSPFYANR